jgi:hypothetical protein
VKLPKAVHPPLIAAFPVLALYRNNLALFPLADLWCPLGVAVGASLVLWLAAAALLRSWERGALAATVASAWVLTYGHAIRAFTGVSQGQSWAEAQSEFLWKWILVGLVALVAVLWSKKATIPLTRAFNVTAIALTVMVGGGLVAGRMAGVRDVAGIKQSSSETDNSASTDRRPPDVFYIIVDGHGSVASLKRAMGFDDGPFVKALEARGFYVATDSRSNYCQTELSLAASLNMETVPSLLPKMDPSSMIACLSTNSSTRAPFPRGSVAPDTPTLRQLPVSPASNSGLPTSSRNTRSGCPFWSRPSLGTCRCLRGLSARGPNSTNDATNSKQLSPRFAGLRNPPRVPGS